ncbi:hypothetical protein [Paludibaculum fermentans]|uniref:Uncharacterized protein n=1 Tax=Paludibaculum fermentans TaxID=1473598 RepID=A0A7S7SMV8_PALFE|nr:hypothetical protein [Paludibaculum fermentans]QOY90338.1 hypothetical protein IRI77_10390 [Paludibaculum fermentans]
MEAIIALHPAILSRATQIALKIPNMLHLGALSSTDLWWLAFLFLWILLSPLVGMAHSFIHFRDVGPPRVGVDIQLILIIALVQGFQYHWISGILALAAVAIYCGWTFKAWERLWASWGEDHLHGSAGIKVRVVPDLSRRINGAYPLLLPQVCFEQLSAAEIDALLARQNARPSNRPLSLCWLMPVLVAFGAGSAPPMLRPVVAAAGIVCGWAALTLCCRYLDRQADARAVRATGDSVTFIQAIAKANALMHEVPQRYRMSTWWLLPTSLEARIAAIARQTPQGRQP